MGGKLLIFKKEKNKMFKKLLSMAVSCILLTLIIAYASGNTSKGLTWFILATGIISTVVTALIFINDLWFPECRDRIVEKIVEKPRTADEIDYDKKQETAKQNFQKWYSDEDLAHKKRVHDAKVSTDNEIIKLREQAAVDTKNSEHLYHEGMERKKTDLAKIEAKIEAATSLFASYDLRHQEDLKLIQSLIQKIK